MKTTTLAAATAAVALTGCVNWNSFNSRADAQASGARSTPAATPAPSARPSPSATPSAKPTPAAPKPANPAQTPAKPTPTPSSNVIKQESSSEVRVLSSRPVVGSDAEMGR